MDSVHPYQHLNHRGQGSLVLEMNRKENLNTSYTWNHKFIRGASCASTEPSNTLFSPETIARNYALYGQAFPQKPHQPGYQISLTDIPDPTAQLTQSAIRQDLHYRTISRNSLQPFSGSYGISKAYTDYLQPKSTSELALQNPNMEKILASSWADLAEPEIKGENHYPNTWTGSTAVQKLIQSEGRAKGKQRIRWTHELHMDFVEAVNNLGGPMKATPKGILRQMDMEGLTTFQIKSHLQKYRTAKDHVQGKSERKTNHDETPMTYPKGYSGFHLSEALRLQMDVQKSLHEHLEFQRKLQMRIEEHANYLQKMFDQQKMSHGFFGNQNSDEPIGPSVAESSSTGGYGENNKSLG